MTAEATTQSTAIDAFTERLFNALLATVDLQSIYLGDRLGFYRALAGENGLTSAELAARTSTAERYAREWLEQQAVTGILTASDDADPTTRRYTLPEAHIEPLTDVLSPRHLVPHARLVIGLGKQMDALAEAYRSGGGVSWAQHGDDVREGQGAANRPLFLGALTREHLPSIPDVDATLRAGGRVAEIGCGVGWAAIGIALAYPAVTVDAFDVDQPAVEAARRNAVDAGVADRVRFHPVDAATLADNGERYDAVFAFECIHDLADPVGVLTTMRRLAGADGAVFVMDERVAEAFTAPGDEVERLMYGYSIICCLPDALSQHPSAATGTVMRPETLRGYATRAGFADIEILDIDDEFFRFYRLVQ